MNSFKVRVYYKKGAIIVYDFTSIEFLNDFINHRKSVGDIKSYEML